MYVYMYGHLSLYLCWGFNRSISSPGRALNLRFVSLNHWKTAKLAAPQRAAVGRWNDWL